MHLNVIARVNFLKTVNVNKKNWWIFFRKIAENFFSLLPKKETNSKTIR